MNKHVVFTLDKYTKLVLTAIAVSLMLITFNLYFSPAKVNATETVQDVNIKSINGSSISGSELPVDMKRVSSSENIGVDINSIRGRNIFGDKIPVDIQGVGGQFIIGGYLPVTTR